MTARCTTRERWAEEITSRAEAYWTRARRTGVFGDRELILPPAQAAPLLRALGLLNGDASMSPSSVRKFMQICHMVAILEPLMLDLVDARPLVRVLDVGCGSSHLTLLLAWCFKHRWRRAAQIMGLDRNEAVIERCRERAELALLDEMLRFEHSSIDELELTTTWARSFGASSRDGAIDVLVALHACDTATDDALALGIGSGAEVIAAAPCCQAELARSWSTLTQGGASGPFAPVWRTPHLRREAAATLTDTLRALLLRGCGYAVTAMEFVPSAHTPKNTLLRAVRRGEPASEHFAEYVALRELIGGHDIRLAKVLPDHHRRRLQAVDRASLLGGDIGP